jgi:DNA transformation protein and related proteins
MGQLATLLNLGTKSEAMLVDAGIDSIEKLQLFGAVQAYCLVLDSGAKASLNLLWALEGALTGVAWQQIAREHRLSLLLALEELKKRSEK